MVNWHSFFFQAEDGIRDVAVTGVQTCALPISSNRMAEGAAFSWYLLDFVRLHGLVVGVGPCVLGGVGQWQADRKSVVLGKSVDLGGRRIIKKKKKWLDDLIARSHNSVTYESRSR